MLPPKASLSAEKGFSPRSVHETVWKRTHELRGKLFKAVGIIALLGIVFPAFAIWLIMIPILAVAVFLFVYSYLEFRKTVSD
ncbi:hypothetical protein COT30_02410 [Candidatus Micrarchaeota archaeon CG08_land_8_20_14_0_20_49_17]|nr:MAG: hypothetical protein AUJ13_05505 [Candidatus Micrarchaeota archaeon CG1_02_49_24]PIU09832.1 MAG: hypothetical protein COT30_02410 [Candidatus Micrarchaeota archaeon CG08_land_8_20_14_0_20_49_17]PIU81392.1 MAG: hypothetical protein COS70_04345 [Candidatus Micrarchaeota archaeon CG06_land_8_20_14_3_00_50_6]PIZ92648.1 MAG: hypothetical protein COX84_06500 [Candidatus Micrarchaeota archaeon CG_4_10_14_0_2_um_filter_49_7]HII53380.1 hypothetical protein [Candidatus Micrarchaeota archaeon]